MVRKEFGDQMVCYADSNGSYDVAEGIKFGKLLEEYKFAFYEEPVPFDWYEETKAVTDAVNIPVAGGEQEASMHAFRWLIANDGLDIVQPDLYYFGGFIRSMKVARMAAAMGKVHTPHISDGLGYLYMIHLVSAIPNAGPYHEFKGLSDGRAVRVQDVHAEDRGRRRHGADRSRIGHRDRSRVHQETHGGERVRYSRPGPFGPGFTGGSKGPALRTTLERTVAGSWSINPSHGRCGNQLDRDRASLDR